MSQALNQLREVLSTRHDYAQQWKARTGGKVVGYLCTYVPEELIHAAGMLPVRILCGHEPQDITQTHIFSMFCAYCQDILSQGLLGRYSYLDGIVFAHCCPHIRQAFESWRQHIPLEFYHLFWVPAHTQNQAAHAFFLAQVREFKEAIEKWRHATITIDRLEDSVREYNLNRRLLEQLYNGRKLTPPAISGATALEIALASAIMEKEKHNQLLQTFIGQPVLEKISGVRLMVIGSENDDVGLIRLIESLGGVVVIEDNCCTNRYFWKEIEKDGDLLPAIASRYLSKPPCPLRDIGPRQRTNYLLELAREYQVGGVIFLRQKFCDPHAYDIPALTKVSKKEGLPYLILELDVTIPLGQYRTRIEAFLEMLI